MPPQLLKREESAELPCASEDDRSHHYTLTSLASAANTPEMTSSLVTSEPPSSGSDSIAHGSEDHGLQEHQARTTWDPASLARPEHSGTLYEHLKSPLGENMTLKPREVSSNMQWLPPGYEHCPSAGHNGFGVRMPYYSHFNPYSPPPYPYGVPPGYFPDVPPPPRAVPPYMRQARYGPGHPYMAPGLMARYPGPYMSLAGSTGHRRPYGPPSMSGEYMPFPCPQEPKPLRLLKQKASHKGRNRNMTSLLVDGRQLNYNWPPPQVRMPQDPETNASEASNVEAYSHSDPSQTQMSAAVKAVPSTDQQSAPSVDVASLAPVNTDDVMTTEQMMEQIHGMCVTPHAVCHAASVTPQFDVIKHHSKATKPIAKATYDMLQEAMKDKPDKAVKIAKTLFSKRMLTLYGWLYPSTAKRDIKSSVDELWDRLPSSEKEFYLSQAEGRFGSRSTGVMVNPQLAALPGLPDDLRFSPSLIRRVQQHHVTHVETEDAVRHLLASDVTRTPEADTAELKRPVERQAKRAKMQSEEGAKKRPSRNLRATRSQLDDLKPPLNLQLLAEVASQRCYEAAEEPLVSYACDEIYAEHEVVLSNGGTELTSGDIAGLGGLDMLGLIADSKMEIIRHQLDNTNKQYDNKWYFPSTPHDVYASDDVLR